MMREAAKRSRVAGGVSESGRPVVCSWTLPDRMATVELRWDLAAATRVLEEHEGKGLLLGEISAGAPLRIVVDEVHAWERDPRGFGPLGPTLAELDAMNLELGVAGTARQIVGIARPCQSAALHPDTADLRQVQQYCKAPPGLLLLSLAGKTETQRGIFLWDEEGMETGCRMVLPPGALESPAGERTGEMPVVGKRPQAHSPVLWALWAIYGLSLILAAGAGITVWRELGQKASPPVREVSDTLDLKVVFEGRHLTVLWNPSCSAVRNAERAYLFVRDGGQVVEIPLSPRVLESGGTDYRPKTSDVTIGLRAVGKDSELQDSVRVLEPAGSRP